MNRDTAGSVAILLLPGFSMSSLGLLTEHFTLADGRAPQIFSVGEEMVPAAHDIRVQAQRLPRAQSQVNVAVVCGGRRSLQSPAEHREVLMRIADSGCQWLAVGSGVLSLAAAGLLRNRRCTAPDGLRQVLQQMEGSAAVVESAYVRDGSIWTCGSENSVCAMLDAFLPAWRHSDAGGALPLQSEVEDRSILAEAQALMRNNLAEPLATGEIADYLGVSSKKLERIFRRFAGQLPARFYIGLRLSLARQLLHHSSCSIEEVGRRCGFGSASHFSRAFRNHFGRSPRAERQQFTALPNWAGNGSYTAGGLCIQNLNNC